MKLGVRPKIRLNESLTGYLMRLTAVNGFEHLPYFLSVLGMKKVKKQDFGLWTDKQLADLYQCLPSMLGRDIDDIKAQHNKLSNIPWLRNELYYPSNVVDFPRICIPCLLEKAIFDWRWSVALTPCCPLHSTPLINNCPQCQSPLKWHSGIFEACTKCKAKWKDIDIRQVHYPKQLLEMLFPDVNGEISLTSKQIQALRLSMIFMARPYDAVIDEVYRFPKTSHFWARIMRAVYLLTQSFYKAMWRDEVNSHWPEQLRNISPITVYDSFLPLNAQWETDMHVLPRLPSLAVSDETDECIEYLQPHRRKLQKYNKDLSFWFHINHIQLAKKLSITTTSLIILTEVKLLPSVNYTKIIRARIFDAKAIHEFIAPFCEPHQQANPVILDENTPFLVRYLVQYGEAIKAILEGGLKGYFIQRHSLSILSVNKDELQAWLNAQYKIKCGSPIVKSKAAKAMKVAPSTIDRYVKQGHLRWAPWQSKYQMIDGAAFYRFFTPLQIDDLKSTSK